MSGFHSVRRRHHRDAEALAFALPLARALPLGLLGLAIVAFSIPASAAPNLDPFRRPTAAQADRKGALSPFASRALAQAQPGDPAPAGDPAPSVPSAEPAPPANEPAAVKQPAAANPAPGVAGSACVADDQCAAGTICQGGTCTPVEPPIRALLFRKEGGSTDFYPFYFSNRGNPGHRVVAPLYWHFWSPEDRAKVVAPFYWRFEDYTKQRTVTVIIPYSHTVQPDAESWAVWPIFYRSTRFGWAAPLLASFKIDNPGQQRSFGLYALLYFWKRNERAGTAFDLLFPLFASSRSPDSAFTFALPLNFYWRDGGNTNLLALPIFYWGKTVSPAGIKNGHTLVTPLGYHSRSRDNHRGAIAWLYWFGRRTDGAKHDVVLPVYWSFRSADSNTTILPPLFLHLRRPTYTFTTVFPLYWAGRNTQAASSWKLFVPLFLARSAEEGRVFSFLSLVAGYRRDDDAGTRTFGAWIPPMLFRRDPQRELDMVLGLYWRHKDKATLASTTLLGPFYRSRDTEGSTTTLFPIFWHFRDAASGSTAHSLIPLYFRRSNPRETLTAAGVFPVWGYYRNHRAGGFAAGLLPIAFFGSQPHRGHGVLFPLFWHFRDEESTTTVAVPAFFRFADKQGSTWGIPPLLYFQSKQHHFTAEGTKTDTARIQFPLFWRFTNGRSGVSTTVIPPLYWRSGASGWSGGLFPLVFAGSWADRGHFVLFPFIWRFRDDKADRSTTVVANYLHRRHGEETTDALFPLFHYRRGTRPGGKPETSFTLLPLVHYRKDERTRVLVTPIAAAVKTPDRKAGLIPPYFWYESRNVSASGVPLLYLDLTRQRATADGGAERTRIFGPFVAVDSAKASSRTLFPLWSRYRDENETGTWVFPTYFRRRHNDSYKLDTLLPVFWYSRSNSHTTTVVGPYYRRTGTDRSATGLVPLFFHAKSPERRYLITPLFYDRDDYKEGTGRLIAALLFYRSTRRDGHTTVAFPLFWSGRTGPRSFSVLFPLFWRFGDDDKGSRTTLLGPFYASSTGDKQRTRGILPLAWYSRDEEKGSASHALMPLFYEKHGRSEQTVLTLPFGFGKNPQRSFWYVPPILRWAGVSTTFTTVFPLFFRHVNRATETSTTVIPPLAFFSRSRPDRSLTGLALLFWRHRDIGSATNLLLPLFYDVHSYHESRFTMLAPVFLRYWRASDDTTYSVAPLFYRRANPSDSTTVAFPLFWDFKGAERRTTILFPLFASFRRPTYVSRYIFPNIYYRKGHGTAEGTSRLLIIPIWESAAKRRGDAMWEVLLGLFGYERIGRNRYVKLFFIPFELEPAPAAQTAWYSRTPPPRTRGPRRYGLDAKTW